MAFFVTTIITVHVLFFKLYI